MSYQIYKKISSSPGFDHFIGRNDGLMGFKKPCSIKFLKSKFQNDPQYLELLFQEAKLNAPLQHRNIIQVYDVIEFNGLYGLVMEHVIGVTLEDLLKELFSKKAKLALPAALFICEEIASALEFAHTCTDPISGESLEIIHCAVSPSNIFLTESGDVKLMNFGHAFSKLRSGETEMTSLTAKFNYVSPEQRFGIKLTASADNFALGVVLWECIAGRFRYEDFELSTSGNNDDLDPEIPGLNTIVPGIDPELNEIVARLTNMNPEERFKSSSAIRRVIKPFLNKNNPGYGADELKVIVRNHMKVRLSGAHTLIKEALSAPVEEHQKAHVVQFQRELNDGDKSSQLYHRGKELSIDSADRKAKLEDQSIKVQVMDSSKVNQASLPKVQVGGFIADDRNFQQRPVTKRPTPLRPKSSGPSNLAVLIAVAIGALVLAGIVILKKMR